PAHVVMHARARLLELRLLYATHYGGARRLRLLELRPEALEPLGLDKLLIEGDRLVVESEQSLLVANVLLGISSGLLRANQFAFADSGRDPIIRPLALLRRWVHSQELQHLGLLGLDEGAQDFALRLPDLAL